MKTYEETFALVRERRDAYRIKQKKTRRTVLGAAAAALCCAAVTAAVLLYRPAEPFSVKTGEEPIAGDTSATGTTTTVKEEAVPTEEPDGEVTEQPSTTALTTTTVLMTTTTTSATSTTTTAAQGIYTQTVVPITSGSSTTAGKTEPTETEPIDIHDTSRWGTAWRSSTRSVPTTTRTSATITSTKAGGNDTMVLGTTVTTWEKNATTTTTTPSAAQIGEPELLELFDPLTFNGVTYSRPACMPPDNRYTPYHHIGDMKLELCDRQTGEAYIYEARVYDVWDTERSCDLLALWFADYQAWVYFVPQERLNDPEFCP